MRFEQTSGLWLPSPSGRVIKSRSLTGGARHGRLVVHSAPFGHGRKGGGAGPVPPDSYLSAPSDSFSLMNMTQAARTWGQPRSRVPPLLDLQEVAGGGPSPGQWLGNLPAGLTKVVDSNWGSAQAYHTGNTQIDSTGFIVDYTRTNVDVVADGTAPRSANVLQFNYNGTSGGNAPNTVYRSLTSTKHIYYATYFKYSSNFVANGASIDKWLFLFSGGVDVTCLMYGLNAPFELRNANELGSDSSYQQSGQGAFPSASLSLNTWYLLEWRQKYDSSFGAGDGLMDLWINGTRTVWNTSLSCPNNGGFDQAQFSPTWGGSGGSVSTNMYIWFDSVAVYAA